MRFGTIDTAYATDLATRDAAADGPIYMVNFMKYKTVAEYRHGEHASDVVSGQEADDRYSPVEVLERIGAHVAFHGPVVAQSCPGEWDRMAIVKYPTRRSFIDMQSRPDFKSKYVHKEAGMEYTIVMGTLPIVSHSLARSGGFVTFRITSGEHGGSASESVARLGVEGTIVGDGRVWADLTMSWSDEIPNVPNLERGSSEIVVVARAEIDQMGQLLTSS